MFNWIGGTFGRLFGGGQPSPQGLTHAPSEREINLYEMAKQLAADIKALEYLSKQPYWTDGNLTAENLACIRNESQAGHLMRAADLVSDVIAESGSLTGIISTIEKGIPTLPYTVDGSDALAEKLSNKRFFAQLVPQNQLASMLKFGLVMGVVPVQINPVPRGESEPGAIRATRQILAWDPRFLSYEWSLNRWRLNTQWGPVYLADDQDCCELENGVQFRLWIPYTHARPWRAAPWRFLAICGILSRDSVYARMRHTMVNGPVRVVTHPHGYNDKQAKVLEDLMAAAGYNGWLRLTQDCDFKHATASGDSTASIYADQLNWAREEAAIGLLGQKTTVTGTSGFSKGNVYEQIASIQRQFYADACAEFLNRCVFAQWARDCLGPRGECAIEIDAESPAEKKERAEGLELLGKALVSLQSGADAVGCDVDRADAIRIARSSGVRLVPKPATTAAKARLDLAPTDVAKAITVDETRASQGLPPAGGAFGQKHLAEVGEPATGGANAA